MQYHNDAQGNSSAFPWAQLATPAQVSRSFIEGLAGVAAICCLTLTLLV